MSRVASCIAALFLAWPTTMLAQDSSPGCNAGQNDTTACLQRQERSDSAEILRFTTRELADRWQQTITALCLKRYPEERSDAEQRSQMVLECKARLNDRLLREIGTRGKKGWSDE